MRMVWGLVGVLILLAGPSAASAADTATVERLLRQRTCVGCDLFRANLNRLDLTGVDLRNANLAYATFREATLVGANLEGADLRGADFRGAQWVDGSICGPNSFGGCQQAAE